jgi:catechol 2,3-dioxygenase-like lactoylglutathione lyase family enzyme
MSPTGSKLGAARISPVLAVDDLDRAVSFYRDKLGLKVEKDGSGPGYALVEAGEGSHVLLYKTTYRRGENTLAAFETEDVEGTVEELRQRGVRFEEYDFPGLKTVNGIATEPSGLKSAWLKDSEGNTISIAQPVSALVKRRAA